MDTVRRHATYLLAAVIAWGVLPMAPVRASDEPDSYLPGKRVKITPGKVRVLGKAFITPMIFDLPDAANDPTVEGGELAVFDTGSTAGFDIYPLPPSGWRALNPPGSGRYRYTGAGTVADPCRVVLVKEDVVKAICEGDGVTLTPPFAGNAAFVLSIGTDTKRYCMNFGGSIVRNDASALRRRFAVATYCATTTTSSSSSTSSTSTTSTIAPGPCCNSEGFLGVTVLNAPGDCGDVIDFTGALFRNIACGGQHLGSGSSSHLQPSTMPDTGESVLTITGCVGETATLGATTSAQTGGTTRCTSAGCLFGAPLPVTSTNNPPVSSCVINTVAGAATGSIDCGLGTASLSLPVASEVFLSGDLLPSEPGIQPCPLCVGGSCMGGPNNGMACVPGSSDLGDTHPTSHDCPPASTSSVGSTSLGFVLGTATTSWTAVSSGLQARVFCGYCRDSNASGAFEDPPHPCLENGTTLSACAEPFESCEQDNSGAFGPAGAGVRTITVIGAPAGNLNDSAPHAATVGGISCAPEAGSAVIDNDFALPGPSATALPVTLELKASP